MFLLQLERADIKQSRYKNIEQGLLQAILIIHLSECHTIAMEHSESDAISLNRLHSVYPHLHTLIKTHVMGPYFNTLNTLKVYQAYVFSQNDVNPVASLQPNLHSLCLFSDDSHVLYLFIVLFFLLQKIRMQLIFFRPSAIQSEHY